ncbi:MAG: arylsulfatase [Deltaproteobacteria bacterium]|nr:arylsulfatase [Deltaproteobacteria bacterium]MBI3391375.1 arylsulfatase [Deltaproteobacteria bacterium]
MNGIVTRIALSLMLSMIFTRQLSAQDVLPRPEPPFGGKIGRTVKESVKDFPKPVEAPKGAPNILLILTDDVGFGASSTFGGPIPTMTMDRLANAGLRYTQFHTTALCSPTRAALLTGRNHHSAATGIIMELATGFPGYNSLQPKSAGTFAEILKQNGYNTSWYGKNHNVPDWQNSQAGPFDLWPTGLGFEYFYGFIGGDTSQWNPALFEGTKPIEPPHDDKNYFFDKDMADHTIAWIRMQHAVAPGKPFLAYYAPGTAHAPHHAPKEWIAKFKGKFDQGWDKQREETFARQKQMGIIPPNAKLTARSEGIPPWDSLDADHKKVAAHMMEVYAAALAHADYQMGRILDAIEAQGELDNTLVIYIQGDNGASAEGGMNGLLNEMTVFNAIPEDFKEVLRRMNELGGPNTFNHYPVGWAHAMDTPFQWAKQIASHWGGTRNGMVISWPARIKDKGGIRPQFHHVIDIMPTILEAAGVPAPTSINGVAQKPIEGVSMVYSFDDAKAPSKHTTQYFEMFANRGIYHDGWVACTTPPIAPWVSIAKPIDINDYKWELYNCNDDFSEADNLADTQPAKLKELQDLFWTEAAKYNVLPIDNSRVERFDVTNRPSLTRGRDEFTYYPGLVRIPEGAAPDTKNKSFRIKAEVAIPKGGAEGMLLTHGGRFSGWGFYLLKGKPVFHYNLASVAHYNITGKDTLPPGTHTIVFDFKYDGGLGKGGAGTMLVDGKPVGAGRIERTLPFRLSLDETLDCGEDTGTPVSDDYHVPFKFTGDLKQVTIDLTPEPLSADDEETLKAGEAAAGLSE